LRIFDREEFVQLIENAGLEVERRDHDSSYWSIWWILFWAGKQDFSDPEGPLLESWTKTWHKLLSTPEGLQIKQALDEFIPKSQVVVARKAA
jgi:hypothetical protein